VRYFGATWFYRSPAARQSVVMQKKLDNTTITVPVPNHSEIRIGTLQSIIRQSGIARTEFEIL